LNIFIHLLNTGLIYLLGKELSSDKRTALLACLLFLLYPGSLKPVFLSPTRVLIAYLLFWGALYGFIKAEEKQSLLYHSAPVLAFFFALYLKWTLLLMLPLFVLSISLNRQKLNSLLPYFIAAMALLLLKTPSPSLSGELWALISNWVKISGYHLQYLIWPLWPLAHGLYSTSPSLAEPALLHSIAGLLIFVLVASYSRGQSRGFLFSLLWIGISLVSVLLTLPFLSPSLWPGLFRDTYLIAGGWTLLLSCWIRQLRIKGRLAIALLFILFYTFIDFYPGSQVDTFDPSFQSYQLIYSRKKSLDQWKGLAISYLNSNNPLTARRLLLGQVKIYPDDPEIHQFLGQSYLQESQYNKAIKELEKALTLNPVCNECLLLDMGTAYQMLKEYPKAIKLFQHVIEQKPEWASPHFQLGNIYDNLGQKEEAIKEYQKAIDLEPAFTLPYKKISQIYDELGRPEEGATYLKKLKEIE